MVVSGWTVKRRATRKRLPWLWLDSSYTRPKPFVFHCFFLCVCVCGLYFFFCKELQCSKRFKEIDFVTRWYFVCCVLFQTEFCSIWMSPSFCSPSTWYWLEGLWFLDFLKSPRSLYVFMKFLWYSFVFAYQGYDYTFILDVHLPEFLLDTAKGDLRSLSTRSRFCH